MIKIIKKGTKETQYCDFCGCVFSYEEEDVNIVQGYNLVNDSTVTTVSIECPQCKNILALQQPKEATNGL